ncbi:MULTISPECIES: hypothetical protein [unclassified Akkermansia]|jgi:hypothetical protein|uniref:hypothetical protein n=1 Tax=unclassified Akkermansia TaxID=2608915 RepID=UPI000A797658|nr:MULTISPECIES: hypothetical protein [unclassified Akkermansia]
MMKKYIICCSIAIFLACISILIFNKYLKKSHLLGEVENTYSFSYDPPLILGNVKIEELSKFNQILANQFPNYQIYATFSGEECTLIMTILYDYDANFSDVDRKKLWNLVSKWTEELWYNQTDME